MDEVRRHPVTFPNWRAKTVKETRILIFEVFPTKGKGKEFGWHAKRGGRIVAFAGGYLRRRGAVRAITNLTSAIAEAQFRIDHIEKAGTVPKKAKAGSKIQ